jgi:hypothetical protein
MQAVDLSKPFSVDVFSDGGPIDWRPWMRLREFDDLSDAIKASKKVIDAHLIEHYPLSSCKDQLAFEYLKQGPMPAIHGAKTLSLLMPVNILINAAMK